VAKIDISQKLIELLHTYEIVTLINLSFEGIC